MFFAILSLVPLHEKYATKSFPPCGFAVSSGLFVSSGFVVSFAVSGSSTFTVQTALFPEPSAAVAVILTVPAETA